MRHGPARGLVRLTELHLRAARAAIASTCVPPPVDAQLGSITLRDDQRETTARVAAALARHGGCLLADDVGRGKTYVALAIARRWKRPVIVVPAALRATWADAMRRADVPCTLISHEALSRGRTPALPCDGIVVDESHHFRSTRARRYSTLASLASGARLLLLSATPLQNRRRDLAAQIALFHGARAFELDDAALATFVVRGTSDDVALPVVAAPIWVHPSMDDGAVLDEILALPSPARPADGGEAGMLRTIGLVRAWASTRAALAATIRRRRRIAAGIEQSIAVGRVPTKRDLSAWTGAEDAIQLGFASLLATTATDAANAEELARAVAREHAGLSRLEASLAGSADPDDARVESLRRVRAAHPGERVLAFTEFAGSARAYFARLRCDAGVGLLTATDARIASGRLPRRALLERFAPRASGVAEPVERERITLLVATDLLSEGMNLQDASVVVHLDLPWNPARLAQRVGRVRRPGGAAVVHAYLIAPPARGEVLLDVERRLRRKLADAAHAIGRTIDVVPRLTAYPDSASAEIGRAALLGETAERLARWRRPSAIRATPRRCIVAAVHSSTAGWLAALDDARLVASLEEAPPDILASVAEAVRFADGTSRPVDAHELELAMCRCEGWIAGEMLARHCGIGIVGPLGTALDRCIARTIERAPRHRRALLGEQASKLMTSLAAPRPLGVERELRRLLDDAADSDDASWLAAALALAARDTARHPTQDEAPRITAMVLIGPWR